MCLGLQGSCWADLWALRALLLPPALRCGVVFVGSGSGQVAKAIDTGQGVCHAPHTSGPSRGMLALQVQASGPGSTCLASEQGPDDSLPGL